MKHIATAVLSAVLVAGTAGVVSAQNAPTNQPPRTERRDSSRRGDRNAGPGERFQRRLFDGITLSADQKARIQQIHKTYKSQHTAMRTEMRKFRDQRQRPDSATMSRWRALMTQERNEVRGVLTPDQQAKFDANVKQTTDRMRERRGRRGDGGRDQRL